MLGLVVTSGQIHRETRSLIVTWIKEKRDRNDNPVCKTGKKTQMCIPDFWTQRERERVG